MAVTFNAAGVAKKVANGNLASVAIPAGFQQDDIHVCCLITADNVTSTLPAGWTKVFELNNGTILRGTIAYRRAVVGDAAFTITHASGDSAVARVFGFRGCKATGIPFDQSNGGTTTASSITATASAITPLVANEALLFVVFASVNTTAIDPASCSGYSGTNPTLVEIGDDSTGLGVNEAELAVAWGIAPQNASTGSRTATLANGTSLAMQSIGVQISLFPNPVAMNNYQFVKVGDGMSTGERIR